MMGSSQDISRIVSLIMENPELIEKIRSLKAQNENQENEETKEASSAPSLGDDTDGVSEAVFASHEKVHSKPRSKNRRTELLCALKPYVSDGRSKAIDSIISIAEILEVVRR
jgi:hypothetical protein